MSSGVNIQVDRAAAFSRVSAPAVTLAVVAGLGMAFQLFAIVMHLLGTGINFAEMAGRRARGAGGEAERIATLMSGGVGLFFAVLGLVVGGLVLFGALKMRRLDSYGLAMTAAILSMVPCLAPCSCCGLPLSLPIGVWALLVLLDQNVKLSFS